MRECVLEIQFIGKGRKVNSLSRSIRVICDAQRDRGRDIGRELVVG